MTDLEHINKLQAKSRNLTKALERSLMLQAFFPPAFNHGPAKTFVTGNAYRPKELIFTIQRGNGERHTWPALEVPPALWVENRRQLLEVCRDRAIRKTYERLGV